MPSAVFRIVVLAFLPLMVLMDIAPSVATVSEPGAVVVVGGGTTTDEIVKATIALTKKPAPTVLVCAKASGQDDAGKASVEMWLAAGAKAASRLDTTDKKAAALALAAADILWMPGGDQNRLMAYFVAVDLVNTIAERRKAGMVVGGTSAGAAVMSKLMITGDADLSSLKSESTALAPGLALTDGMICDQHFHRRRRFNRLLSVVLDHPESVGVGVDESTAAIVRGQTIEVIGESSVLVIDARTAVRADAKKGENEAATGVAMHLLRRGMTIDLAPAKK